MNSLPEKKLVKYIQLQTVGGMYLIPLTSVVDYYMEHFGGVGGYMLADSTPCTEEEEYADMMENLSISEMSDILFEMSYEELKGIRQTTMSATIPTLKTMWNPDWKPIKVLGYTYGSE